MNFSTGDEVTVTIKGTVVDIDDDSDSFAIKDKAGWHMSFAPFADECVVEVVASEPEYADGLYMDDDGEIFLSQGGEWFSFQHEGTRYVHPEHAKRMKPVTLPFDAKPW